MSSFDHDKTLDHMLGIEDTTDALLKLVDDADERIHEVLRAYGKDIPNLSFMGCVLFQMRDARKLGEQRGGAIERSMFAGLFVPPEPGEANRAH